MSDMEKLNKARKHFARGEYTEAREILETISTTNPSIRLNTLSMFIGVLDHVSENDRLLSVANEGIKIATRVGNSDMRNYFLGKKCFFLMSQLSNMIYRQTNLMLSSRVFEWLGFSLMRDKKEYEAILEARAKLEAEIEATITAVIESAEQNADHNFRGHQFSTIGDAYSSKYLADKLDYQEGGRIKSKIANMYLVRRWNLDRYLYESDVRKKIDHSHDKCIEYFQRSIKEFALAELKSEQAHSMYNLVAKLQLFNHFYKARKLLTEVRRMAESINERGLLTKIEKLERAIADKNRNIRDYVSEQGLDMPDGHLPSL